MSHIAQDKKWSKYKNISNALYFGWVIIHLFSHYSLIPQYSPSFCGTQMTQLFFNYDQTTQKEKILVYLWHVAILSKSSKHYLGWVIFYLEVTQYSPPVCSAEALLILITTKLYRLELKELQTLVPYGLALLLRLYYCSYNNDVCRINFSCYVSIQHGRR